MSRSQFTIQDSNSASTSFSFHLDNMGRQGMREQIVEMRDCPLLLAVSTMAAVLPLDNLLAILKAINVSISGVHCSWKGPQRWWT